MRRFRPRSRPLAAAGGLLLLLSGPSLVHAQSPGFEATAAVPIQGPEELVAARAQALNDALGRALEQAVAQVAPESRSRLYLILGRAREYIASYRVLDEGEQAGQFQVRVEVQLDLPRLLRDLQASPRPSPVAGLPPMVVCTAASGFEAQAAVAAARTLLDERLGATESLSAEGCAERLRREATAGSRATPLLVLQPDPEPRTEAIRGTQPPRVGATAHAEWLLYPARAVASSDPPLREVGEATLFLDSAASARSEAQRQAALGGLNRLLARPGLLSPSPAGVTLTLEGVGRYANYQQLLQTLSSLPGVSRVEPRRISVPPPAARVNGEEEQVQVLLHTASSAETIGAALGRTPLNGLRLQVAPVGPSALRVICVPLSALPASQPSDENPPELRPGEGEAERTP